MDTPQAAATSSTGLDLRSSVRRTLRDRRAALAILATAALATGAALNWSWLVAAGVVPLLLSVLPCIAMCALGLCMNRMAGRSCANGSQPAARVPAPPPPSAKHPESTADPACPSCSREARAG